MIRGDMLQMLPPAAPHACNPRYYLATYFLVHVTLFHSVTLIDRLHTLRTWFYEVGHLALVLKLRFSLQVRPPRWTQHTSGKIQTTGSTWGEGHTHFLVPTKANFNSHKLKKQKLQTPRNRIIDSILAIRLAFSRKVPMFTKVKILVFLSSQFH